MWKPLVLTAAALSLALASCSDDAGPTSSDPLTAAVLAIDFERFPGPDGALGTSDDVPTPQCPGGTGSCSTTLAREYEPTGVTFESFWMLTYQHGENPNNLANNQHRICALDVGSTEPSVRFAIPVYGVAVTSWNVWPVRLEAFAADGSLLGSTLLPHPNPGCPTSCPQVHGILVFDAVTPITRVRLVSLTDEGERVGGCFDDLVLRLSLD